MSHAIYSVPYISSCSLRVLPIYTLYTFQLLSLPFIIAPFIAMLLETILDFAPDAVTLNYEESRVLEKEQIFLSGPINGKR